MKNKLFLEEGEITRILNMHKRAINEELNINGGEVGNKRGILNEGSRIENYGDGGEVTVDFDKYTLRVNKPLDCEKDTPVQANELQLPAGLVFNRVNPKGIPYNGQLETNSARLPFVDDINGMTVETSTDKVIFKCESKKFMLYNRTGSYIPENFPEGVLKGFETLCQQTPTPVVAAPVVGGGGASPEVDTNVKGKKDVNWGGSGTDPNRYWTILTKLLGAKLDKSTEFGSFIYKGPLVIWGDYSMNGGYNISSNGVKYKFDGNGNKYVGQSLDNTFVVSTDGSKVLLSSLLGATGKSGGGGTGGGTGKGGGTGTPRKKYTFDVAAVNKLIDEKCSKNTKPQVGGGGIDLDATGTPKPIPIPNMPTDQFNTL